MFGVSYMEMLIIALIALIVVGPEHLPELAVRLGRFMRTLNMARFDVGQQINEAIRAPLTRKTTNSQAPQTENETIISPLSEGTLVALEKSRQTEEPQ